MPPKDRRHHQGAYARLAAHVRAMAYTNPATRCWRCDRTLDRCGPRGDGRNANGTRCTWEAGHLIAGQIVTRLEQLRAECSHCNRSAGATAGNRRRASGYDWP